VGVHAIAALRESYVFPGNVDLIDGGTMGLDLLPFIEGSDRLLIIDAVDFSAEPGTVRVIEGKDLSGFLDTKLSVHQIGLPDMLFAAAMMGIIPPEMCLVGIQPGRIETGLQMTEKLREHFQTLIDAVLERLAGWGVEVNDIAALPAGCIGMNEPGGREDRR
jgi:hydrogenase maturation protease